MITLGTVVSPVRGKLGLCNRILLLLSSLLLASCALGPDYSRPPIDPAERFAWRKRRGNPLPTFPGGSFCVTSNCNGSSSRPWWKTRISSRR